MIYKIEFLIENELLKFIGSSIQNLRSQTAKPSATAEDAESKKRRKKKK